MTDTRFRAGVQPGDGVVARYGDAAVVIASGGDAFTDALLGLLSSYDDLPALVWRVAALVAAHQPGVPAFALAVGGPSSRRVLVHGSARAVVDGQEVVAGGVWTWVERTFGGTGGVALTLTGGPVAAAPRSDLRDGVLAGAGLVLDPAPAPPPAPSPAATPAPAARSVRTPRPPTVDEVGSTIARGHPGETVHLADVIAALRGDDGSRVPLDRDYVFGRDPRQDPAVVRGAASPIKIDDGEQLISRVHAYVAVAKGQVTVRDCGSANGTFIAAPGAAAWTPVGRDPLPVPIGHSLRFGLRVYTHVPAEEGPAGHPG